MEPDYYVYTDGACSKNGSKYAKSGIGIFFGENDQRNVSRTIDGKQTNNTAELTAIIETFDIIKEDIESGMNIGIVSDSNYAILCATKYGAKMFKTNWNVDIPNKTLVKKCYELYKDHTNVKFIHIMAHTGKDDIHSIGNKNADKLATECIQKEPNENGSIIFLDVPFSRKDEAKSLGCKWNFKKKKWFTYTNNENLQILYDKFQI